MNRIKVFFYIKQTGKLFIKFTNDKNILQNKIIITYTLRKLVAANNCVLFGASSTFVIDITGSNTRKYTTASTATVTESFVKIYMNTSE